MKIKVGGKLKVVREGVVVSSRTVTLYDQWRAPLNEVPKYPCTFLIDKCGWRGARHPAKKVDWSDAHHNSSSSQHTLPAVRRT